MAAGKNDFYTISNLSNIWTWTWKINKSMFETNLFKGKLSGIVLQDFTHRDSISSLVAKMRICCFGSPTIFMVTDVRKCQTERVNIFWIYFAFILNSGSFFFLFTIFFQNRTKEKATRTQNEFKIDQVIQFGIFLHLWL